MIGQEFGGKWANAYADEYDRLLRIRLLRAFPHFLVDKLKGRTRTYPVANQLEKQVSIRHEQRAFSSSRQEMIDILQAIDGIGKSRARAIYNEFGSIKEILNSPIDRLATIHTRSGILGIVLAEIIIAELGEIYRGDESDNIF